MHESQFIDTPQDFWWTYYLDLDPFFSFSVQLERRSIYILFISKIQPNTKVRDRNPSPSKGTYDSAAVYTLQAIHESTLMPEGKSRKDFRYLLFMVIGHCATSAQINYCQSFPNDF